MNRNGTVSWGVARLELAEMEGEEMARLGVSGTVEDWQKR